MGRCVGVHRYQVIGQITVDGCTVLRVIRRVFEQGHANPHYNPSLDLIALGPRIHDASRVNHRHNLADTQAGDQTFRFASGEGRPLFVCSFAYRKKSPVVYTCGVSVLQDLRRTKAVLGGL